MRTPWYLKIWSYNLNLNLSNETQNSGNPVSSALPWITAANAGTANIPKTMLATVCFMYSNSKFAYDHNVKSQCLQKILHSRRNCPSITTHHSSCCLRLNLFQDNTNYLSSLHCWIEICTSVLSCEDHTNFTGQHCSLASKASCSKNYVKCCIQMPPNHAKQLEMLFPRQHP